MSFIAGLFAPLPIASLYASGGGLNLLPASAQSHANQRRATKFIRSAHMPRSEDVLSVFLASPGDVSEERLRLADVVTDWNRAWSRELRLRLNLLQWEYDAYPDIDDDAQAVINRQVPADWDIFIGVMWSRFGTPTGRAGSGTQEEFERALARHRSAAGSIGILFYFKDAPIPPSKIEPGQLQQVQAFKQTLHSQGLLTWDFADIDQFEKLATLHLTKHVQEWRKKRDTAPDADPLAPPPGADPPLMASPVSESDAADYGYLDLLEEFTARSAEMAEIASRITAAQQLLTERSARGREELDALRANPATLSPKAFRSSIARVADEMLNFTSTVEAELPTFRSAIDASMTSLTRLATVSADLYPEKIGETRNAAIVLLANLVSARQATEGFRDSTAALPRMTKELNVAKRKQVGALNALIAEFLNGEQLLTESLTVIQGLATTEVSDERPGGSLTLSLG